MVRRTSFFPWSLDFTFMLHLFDFVNALSTESNIVPMSGIQILKGSIQFSLTGLDLGKGNLAASMCMSSRGGEHVHGVLAPLPNSTPAPDS